MSVLTLKCHKALFLFTTVISFFLCVQSVQADDNPDAPAEGYMTIDKVNLRTSPSLDGEVISVVSPGTLITIQDYDPTGWSTVILNNTEGYMKSEYIGTLEQYEAIKTPKVELLDWDQVKNIFTTGVDAAVYDVRSGQTYYVRSFSNGLHADVEPVTKEDTAILLGTYGGRWEWDPRPVWVTINGHTIAGSINGMPHGGGVNPNNGMNGQVCIHFRGSTTHNGNKAFARDHQDAITEAWNAAN